MSRSEASRSWRGRAISVVHRSAFAVRASLGRRDAKVIAMTASAAYLAVYLVGLGHLGRGAGGVDLVVVADPLARMTERMAPFQYEPVALLALGPVDLLVAPVNLGLGAVLAGLVGVNLAVSWVAWRGPRTCRFGPGAAVAAGVPGVLSGFACCGPTILLVVGVQASAGLLAAMRWFVPTAIVVLLATLLWVGTRVEPASAANG
ncbi:MAG: hypothetical protein ACLFMX_01010 [Halobacteriales archaeon]